jgi:hypothetical protein
LQGIAQKPLRYKGFATVVDLPFADDAVATIWLEGDPRRNTLVPGAVA